MKIFWGSFFDEEKVFVGEGGRRFERRWFGKSGSFHLWKGLGVGVGNFFVLKGVGNLEFWILIY